MGSYTFKWEHDADEAFVTGTFDSWRKSVRLEKKNGIFQRTVHLDDAADKVYYKFVVDHNWTINSSCPHEADRDGNINNYLTRADLAQSPPGTSPFISTVSPDSSTVAMAGKKNKSKKGSAAKQQTPPTATPPTEPVATGSSAVAPSKPVDTTATPTVGPGGFPNTPTGEDDKTVGINPMPAAAGAVNPVQLAPGEKVPKSVSAQGANEHVKLDEDSYNKSDALPGSDPHSQLPPVSKQTIPESSLPMGNGPEAHINTVGPTATTASLAGAVPREPAAPDMVKKSQDKAGFAPEASAVPEEVREKSKLEKELQDKVDKAPTTSEGIAGSASHKPEHKAEATSAGAVAAGAATAGGLGDSAKQKAPEPAKDDARGKASSPGLGEATDSAFGAQKTTEPELAKDVKQPPTVDERTSSKTNAHKSMGASAFGTHESTSGAAKPTQSQVSELPTHETKSDLAQGTGTEATEAKADDTKTAGATAGDSKPVDSKAVEAKAEDSTPEATKLTESQAASSTPEPAKTQEAGPETPSAANGSGTKPSGSNSSPAEATPEKKKKNRLSTMFTKIKEKLSDKK